MPDVTITLRTIDESSKTTEKVKKNYEGLVPGLEKAGRSIGDFASKNTLLIGTLVAAGAAAKAAYGEYQKYAGDVRDLALASGANAEEASKLLQVLDDFEITAGDVTAATRFMTKQGLTPNLETLAKLSDQYVAINDPMEKNEFLLKNLGRAGLQWANALSKGGNELRDMAREVDKNLILTDEQIEKAEKARLAVDAWSDAWQGLKVSAGAAIGDIIVAHDEAIEKGEYLATVTGMNSDQMRRAAQSSREYAAKLNGMSAEYERAQAMGDYWAEILDVEVTPALQDNAAAIQEVSDNISSQISLIDRMQSAEESYTEKSKDLAGERSEVEAELAQLRAQGYSEQSEQIQNALSEIEDIKTKEAELAAERDKQTLQFISNILAQNLAREGWTQSEFEAFAKQQEAWGLWSADVVEKAKAAWQEADKVTNSINNMPNGKTIDVILNTLLSLGSTTGSVGGDKQGGVYNAPGMAQGGPVSGGKMYEVTEGGMPELLGIGGKQYLMMPPGMSGNVIPAGGTSGGSTGGGGVNVFITLSSATPDPERVARELKPAVMRILREVNA